VAHCEERVHPIGGFANLVVLVAAGVVLAHTHDEIEDGDEGADGVGIAAEHNVAEADVVVGRDMTCGDAGEGRLLVELNVVRHLQGERKVAEVDVHAQEANDGEVAKHTVQRALSVLAHNLPDKYEDKQNARRDKLTQFHLPTCPPGRR
jgi:hypothetical protein